MLINQLKEDLIKAQKEKDILFVSVLRFLLAEINNVASSKYPPSAGGIPANGLPDEDIISVLQKQVKTHHESIEAFGKGNRQDLVDKEKAELVILQKYLPEQMTGEEIRKIVEEVKASGISDFGQVMKEVMGRVKGKADGGMVSKIVRELTNDNR
mgnify:CR=1 FL=1